MIKLICKFPDFGSGYSLFDTQGLFLFPSQRSSCAMVQSSSRLLIQKKLPPPPAIGEGFFDPSISRIKIWEVKGG